MGLRPTNMHESRAQMTPLKTNEMRLSTERSDEESAFGGFKEKQIPRYVRDDRPAGLSCPLVGRRPM